jgi:oligosaccharide reducing-end xylanase
MPLRFATPRFLCVLLALALLASCKSSLDSIGCNERPRPMDGGAALAPLWGPDSYPNAFRDVLGKSDDETNAKIDATYRQLFYGDASSSEPLNYGDPSTKAIYFLTGTNKDQALIFDVLHSDTRTEGIGLGMMITVELDKRDDFDRLWRYAKSNQYSSGPNQGYFPSFCDNGDNTIVFACNDPFGLEEIATALLLARGRWQSTPGTIDYGQEASILLDLIRYKEAYSCGIVDGVTGTFDLNSKLVYSVPKVTSANISQPSLAMPAYYELWQQATGDAFWSQAATAARAYWKVSSDLTTGLMPLQAAFDGTPVPGWDTFKAESYRTFINMALDCIWSGSQPWVVDESNLLLHFFYGQGINTYSGEYSLDGTVVDSEHQAALVAANGALAAIATMEQNTEFIQAVWDLTLPTGKSRYFPGIMDMMALLILSGQMIVY